MDEATDDALFGVQARAGYDAFAALHDANLGIAFPVLAALVDDLNEALKAASVAVGLRTHEVAARVERWDTSPLDSLSRALLAIDDAGVKRSDVVAFVEKWSVTVVMTSTRTT